MRHFILLFAMLMVFTPKGFSQEQGTLTLIIDSVPSTKGSLYIALYKRSADFLKDEGIFIGDVVKVTQAGKQEWVRENLDYDQYAIAIYHDVNDNGEMDKNLWGVPKEPYAFSKKEPSKWRSPAFEEVAFRMDSPDKKIITSLELWKDR